MKQAMKLICALALAVACGCSGPTRPAAQTPEPATGPSDEPAAKPRLVVLLVIDQFPAWSFLRYEPLLSGGLARLANEGVVYERVELPYAGTYTAPGHAALSTGAPPRVTGILANHFLDRKTGEMTTPIADPTAPIFIPGDGTGDPALGASPRALLVPGIADALEAATGGKAHTVTLAIKDRAAIMVGGQHPDIAAWYEPAIAAITTSRYYTDRLPDWLAKLAAEHPPSARFATVWTPLDDAVLARATKKPDKAPGEGEGYGFDTTFPHEPAATPKPAVAFKATPMATEAILQAARAAVTANRLGADEVPDFLAVSFSAHDYAAHVWGQESWERIDLWMRLDRELAEFLAFLDAQVGRGNYAVIVASDHGATPLPEESIAAKKPGRRVDPAKILAAAESGAASVLGPGDHFGKVSGLTMYPADALRQAPADKRAAAVAAAAQAVAKLPGIAYAAPTATLLGHCETRSGLEKLLCESVREESGVLAFAPARYALITSYPTGTGHGSPSIEDRTIPVMVYAPGWAPARIRDRRSMLQVAPTATYLLGVPAPAAASAPPLTPDPSIASRASRGERATPKTR